MLTPGKRSVSIAYSLSFMVLLTSLIRGIHDCWKAYQLAYRNARDSDFDEHVSRSLMGDVHAHDSRSKQNNNNESVLCVHVDFPNRGNDPDGENDISDHVEYRHCVL